MAIYSRITAFAEPSDLRWFCCDERMAICPDCGANVCVFCDFYCVCGESVF